MRAIPLRAQLVVVLILVQLYSLGVGVSYWLQNRAHQRLEESFRRDLAALSQLPRLRDRLRRLDAVTDNYLLTGSPSWLKERQETLEEVRRLDQGLADVLAEGAERDILKKMDQQLTSYLAQQGQWISRRQAGRLSPAEAARIIKRERVFDAITDQLLAMKDANVANLDRRMAAAHQASLQTLALILATGLAAGGAIVFFLARYLVGPIRALQSAAGAWRLGKPWTTQTPPASPEMADLFGAIAEMSGHLNRQFEKEQELSQLKTQLVSMVSHEFNNALSVISNVSLLLEETETGETSVKRGGYYAILKSHIRALSLAAGNILNMGRLESGQFAIKPWRADIRPLLKETAERLGVLCERKGLELKLELPASPALVHADLEALALVVTNLLGNAIKYTPQGGRVALGLRADPASNERLIVYIRDSGIGISAQDQERIFSPYFRTEEGKKAAKGFGVGLALAHSLVEAHGSVLKVESDPGKGAEFSFALPTVEIVG